MPLKLGRASRNALWLTLVHGANYLVPLIALPYLVRTLGSANFGALALSQALVQYLAAITEYGFTLTGVRAATARLNDRDRLSQLYWSVTMSKVMLAVVSFGILFAIVSTIDRFAALSTLCFVTFSTVVGRALASEWILQAAERMRPVAVISIVTRFSSLGLLLLIVVKPDDVMLAAAIQGGAVLLLGLATAAYSIWTMRLTPLIPSMSHMASTLREGFPVFLSRIATSTYSASSVMIVGIFFDNRIVGSFAAAERIVRALGSAASPIVSAFYPSLIASFQRSRPLYRSRFVKLLSVMCMAFGVLSIVLATGGSWVSEVLFTNDAEQAGTYIRLLSPVPLLVAAGNVLGVCGVLVFGKDRAFTVTLFAGATTGIGAMLALTSLLGPQGTAIGVALAELTVVLLLGQVLRKAFIAVPR